ncbi:MAG: PilN domain-containing protein [Acidobacteria bacterium]|nr:PilN domain-containing protein [Acidobacteriota bacterium]
MAELRLAPDAAPFRLHDLLPAPKKNPVENDLSRNALPYAAALAGACPRLAPAVNLLPAERRSSKSRAMLIPTAVLTALLLLVAGALLARSGYQNRRYLQLLEQQIATLEPQVVKAAALDRQIDSARSRSRLLDEFRGRTRSDLVTLNELTHLLPPPIWTSNIELTRDAVTINGEADQAAALLSVIDASPLFRNSEFSSLARSGNNEVFRIRTIREVRK